MLTDYFKIDKNLVTKYWIVNENHGITTTIIKNLDTPFKNSL